ncbi:hypothetical protein OG758_29850 [Streptomyces sp. NBC_01474]|uniref:hypothetical protein n=1 Tax=unclassified Streptomyces TaxID=2593676 RepID=UPI002DDA4656|nr:MULTISPECIES: hypothetical protein [unclassified Streptomyces]WSD97989.1 hypothetical protein OG758_29850 [Streptomyces sp. NBC_01474]
MDLDALRHLNFSQLDDAIDDWDQMARGLKTVADNAEKNLKGKADRANWTGYNAAVTREFVDKTSGEFSDAHTQADTVTKILKDTRGELGTYKTQLNTLIDSTTNMTVVDTGNGSFNVIPNPTTDPAGAKTNAASLRDQIEGILKKASESDTTAAKALRLIVDHAEYGFSDASYNDRDSAAAAIKAAEEAAKTLRKDPHDVTNTELSSLDSTLAKYKNDPLFAEQFAVDAGPKKIMTFYAGIADPYGMHYDPERGALAKKLQKNLGITLGTATLSDSANMRGWEKQMVSLGSGELGTDDANNPRGFAVMSNLMRFGDYDDQFLNDYGDKLYAFDKEHNVKGLSPWVNNWNQGDLNFWGKDDRGRDPMTGFLEALGHNPDASTQFFEQPDGSGAGVDKDSEINDHLKYLTKDRIWLSDATLDGNDKVVAGRDSLGHALEAATIGYPYDADAKAMQAGDHRTAATAGVMEQVAYLYGSKEGPDMLHAQPELADSLGKMGGAYIDDLDYNLSGVGESAMDGDTFPPKYPGRAHFTNEGAINFLSVLGQDENSHRAVTAAQHLYALSALDAYPPTTDANIGHAHDVLTTEAQARGILDNSRVQQAEATYKAGSEEANKSLGRSADWIKLGAGAVVGGGIAAIPLPGSTAAALVVAPLAADTVGEAVNTFIGHQVDKGVDAAEKDPTQQAQVTSSEFYKKGVNQLGSEYASYIEDSPKAKDIGNQQDWNEDINNAYYGTGSQENDYRGLAPHKD